MDDPNITMEEYIRLQEEKAQRAGRTLNWKTGTYGKVKYYEDEDDCFTNFKSEFPAIVFDDTSNAAALLGTHVNMSLFSTPEPEVGYSNDLDFFKDFENEFPTIVYNDALTSKSDFLTEPTESPQHINEFNLKNETSLSECDEKEQNVLYFNDLFPFNVIYPDDLKSDTDTDNDNDIIDIEQPSGDMSVIPLPNGINVDTQGSNKLLETRSGYQQKDRKPSQNDKTEHGMEKTVQNQGQTNDDFIIFENLRAQVKELQSENEHLKSKVVDCTMCQNLQVQVEELKSVNESLNLSVEELSKARALVEATLRERDKMISAQCKKIRLFEEQSKIFHEENLSCLEKIDQMKSQVSELSEKLQISNQEMKQQMGVTYHSQFVGRDRQTIGLLIHTLRSRKPISKIEAASVKICASK
ncbi:hypothetical protein Tco_0490097 [Tanacetum coccineum]